MGNHAGGSKCWQQLVVLGLTKCFVNQKASIPRSWAKEDSLLGLLCRKYKEMEPGDLVMCDLVAAVVLARSDEVCHKRETQEKRNNYLV